MDGTHPEVMETKKTLKEVMSREIRILRELLGSMYEEQQSHLTNNIEVLKTLLKDRERLLSAMAKEREDRLQLIAHLYKLLKGKELEKNDEHESLDILTEYASAESCEILMLRDQMLALLEQMTEQGNRNNYLLESKVSNTKELLRRVHPADPNPTYGRTGNVQKQKVKTKVTIINREV